MIEHLRPSTEINYQISFSLEGSKLRCKDAFKPFNYCLFPESCSLFFFTEREFIGSGQERERGSQVNKTQKEEEGECENAGDTCCCKAVLQFKCSTGIL